VVSHCLWIKIPDINGEVAVKWCTETQYGMQTHIRDYLNGLSLSSAFCVVYGTGRVSPPPKGEGESPNKKIPKIAIQTS
jgi:hypothetical protein